MEITMKSREKKTRELVDSIDLEELEMLLLYCQPDKYILSCKKYGFHPIEKIVREALADAILLKF